MAKELLFGPVGIEGYLREEGTSSPTILDVDAVLAILEFTDVSDAAERCEDRNFDADVVEFRGSDGVETIVLEGCCMSHFENGFMEGIVLTEVSYATT
jgi:hypothetical protein